MNENVSTDTEKKKKNEKINETIKKEKKNHRAPKHKSFWETHKKKINNNNKNTFGARGHFFFFCV